MSSKKTTRLSSYRRYTVDRYGLDLEIWPWCEDVFFVQGTRESEGGCKRYLSYNTSAQLRPRIVCMIH